MAIHARRRPPFKEGVLALVGVDEGAPDGEGEWVWEEAGEPESWDVHESSTWPGESQWQGVNQGAEGYDESVWA